MNKQFNSMNINQISAVNAAIMEGDNPEDVKRLLYAFATGDTQAYELGIKSYCWHTTYWLNNQFDLAFGTSYGEKR